MMGLKEPEVLVYTAALGQTGNLLDYWDMDGAPGQGVCIHMLLLVNMLQSSVYRSLRFSMTNHD